MRWLCLLLLLPMSAFADVYNVSAWGVFQANSDCQINCTETISANYQLDPNNLNIVIPGSFSFTASGFLGGFSSFGGFSGPGEIELFNSLGDEVDIGVNPDNPLMTPWMGIWSCMSSACVDYVHPAYAYRGFYVYGTSGGSITVPEPSSLALLLPVLVWCRSKIGRR